MNRKGVSVVVSSNLSRNFDPESDHFEFRSVSSAKS